MITLANVSHYYNNDNAYALSNVSLQINDRELVYIIGTTGAGKSTLIKLLDREIKPTYGEVYVNNINLSEVKDKDIPFYRRTIGVIFQNYQLLPKKTAFENVLFALEVTETDSKEAKQRAWDCLELVGLTEKASFYPSELSGGQQQRVAIARALANRPSLVIADEPTGNLDPETSDAIMQIFHRINALGSTVLIVTHDISLVQKYPARTINIEKGMIAYDTGALHPKQSMQPQSEFASAVTHNVLEAEQQEQEPYGYNNGYGNMPSYGNQPYHGYGYGNSNPNNNSYNR